VDDARRVHLGQPLAGLEADLAGLVEGEPTARGDHRGEIAALQVLHHDERDPVGVPRLAGHAPHVADARDVLALHLRRDLGLAQEPLDDLRVAHRLRSRNLMATCWSSSTCVAATTTPMPLRR